MSPPNSPPLPRLVAIGASTGGPAALATILGRVPAGSGLGVLVVQHMESGFIEGFVDWLATRISLKVRVARAGDQPAPDLVLVAPAGMHMRFGAGGRIKLDTDPPLHSCRPAVDALFTSLAEHAPRDSFGVLLTGIGDDGAQGLLAMRRAGMSTIAQDEASSVIYGMPRAAQELGAVEHGLAVEEIGRLLGGLNGRRFA